MIFLGRLQNHGLLGLSWLLTEANPKIAEFVINHEIWEHCLRHFLSQQSGAKYQLGAQHWEEFTVIRVSIGLWKTAGKLWPIKFEFSVRDDFLFTFGKLKDQFLSSTTYHLFHSHEFLSRHEVQNLNLTKSSPQESCWDLSQHSLTLSALWHLRLSAILQCFKELDLVGSPPLVLKVYPDHTNAMFKSLKIWNWFVPMKLGSMNLWCWKSHWIF